MELTPDQLQNELIVIGHHVQDALEGLEEGDVEYAKNSLHDIGEAVARLKEFLPPDDVDASEIERIAGELE